MKKLLIIILVLGLGAGGMAFYVRQQWRTPGMAASDGGFVEIPRGVGTRSVVALLEQKKVVTNRYAAIAYIIYSGSRNKLQAGEYLFDHPMTIPEVVAKMASGAVYLHKFTVPEGLTTTVVAQKWQEQGF